MPLLDPDAIPQVALPFMADDHREEARLLGDAARLWTYVSEAVPAWLVGHVQTMDLMTSRFVAARGG
jgi:hypothetical protein